MVNYVTEKSYIACVDELERRLAARKPDLDVRHVVIVPDVYTFELEKRLMLGFGGAFDLNAVPGLLWHCEIASGVLAEEALTLIREFFRKVRRS